MKSDYVMKKYKVCMKIYNLLQLMCKQSYKNQEYAFKFIFSLVSHLGYGRFVSKCLAEILKGNEKLLYSLHKVTFTTSVVSVSYANLPIDAEKRTLISEIVNRIKEFRPYEKDEIFDLLKDICLYNNQAIYINQDTIFRMMYEDVHFRTMHLIELSNDNDQVFINHRGMSYPFDQFFQNEESTKSRKDIRFLKSQLDLYATLCLNRNYTSAKAIGKIFTMNTLIKYIENHDIPDDIRAILVKLVANIHIDREPRTVQERPNLVKVADIDLSQMEQRYSLKNKLTLKGKKVDKSQAKLNTELVATTEGQDLLSEKRLLDEKDRDDESLLNIEDESLTDELLDRLKGFLLDYLEEKSTQCKQNAPAEKIYTRLTFEVIKLTAQMLKFGLFKNKLAIKPVQEPRRFLTRGCFTKETSSSQSNITRFTSEVEKLIKHLTPLLEYDEGYFKCMRTLGVKRSKIIYFIFE